MTDDSSGVWHRGEIPFEGIDRYARSFSPTWRLDFRQMDQADELGGGCRYVSDGRHLVYDERYSATIALRGTVGHGLVSFVITDGRGRSGRWQGSDHPEAALAHAGDRREIDVLLPRGTRNLVAVLPEEVFHELFGRLADRPAAEVFGDGGLFRVLRPERRAHLEREWRGLIEAPDDGGRMGERVVEALVVAMGEADVPDRTDWPRARRLFRWAVEYCEASERPVFSPGELALRLGVSLRTVQLAFRQCAGIPPCRYLRMLRLNRVHAMLSRLGPGDISVHAAALDWGFRELGRFSGQYRRVFGELPSGTLARRAPRTIRRLPKLSCAIKGSGDDSCNFFDLPPDSAVSCLDRFRSTGADFSRRARSLWRSGAAIADRSSLAGIPPGCVSWGGRGSGGVARSSLNHRLLAGIPPGSWARVHGSDQSKAQMATPCVRVEWTRPSDRGPSGRSFPGRPSIPGRCPGLRNHDPLGLP